MTFIIGFSLRKPGITKGTLFGRGKVPIKIISFGFFSILKLEFQTLDTLNEIIDKSLNIDEYIIQNSEILNQYKLQESRDAQERIQDYIETIRESRENDRNEIYTLRNEIRDLQGTIKSLAKLSN